MICHESDRSLARRKAVGGPLSERFLLARSRRSSSSSSAGCSAAGGDLQCLRQQVSDRQFAANLFAGLNLVPFFADGGGGSRVTAQLGRPVKGVAGGHWLRRGRRV